MSFVNPALKPQTHRHLPIVLMLLAAAGLLIEVVIGLAKLYTGRLDAQWSQPLLMDGIAIVGTVLFLTSIPSTLRYFNQPQPLSRQSSTPKAEGRSSFSTAAQALAFRVPLSERLALRHAGWSVPIDDLLDLANESSTPKAEGRSSFSTAAQALAFRVPLSERLALRHAGWPVSIDDLLDLANDVSLASAYQS